MATARYIEKGHTIVIVSLTVDAVNVANATAIVEAHIARMTRDDAILSASITDTVARDDD